MFFSCYFLSCLVDVFFVDHVFYEKCKNYRVYKLSLSFRNFTSLSINHLVIGTTKKPCSNTKTSVGHKDLKRRKEAEERREEKKR